MKGWHRDRDDRRGPPPAWMKRRRRGMKGLQGRLLLWFLAAITLAIGASVLTTVLTSSNNNEEYPSKVVSRHVQQRVARLWDDPAATEAYIAELRDTTGLDIRVRRDPSVFPTGPRARAGGMVFDDGIAYIPVVKHGQVVGALELRTGTPAPQAWRVVVALIAALFVLGAVAKRVSMHLARPLEHVAATAEKFGSGDLAARTGVEKLPRRWVAEEVRELGRAFDNMADRISRVVLEQRELLAAISHELRSPLGRARVAVEIARERSEGSLEGEEAKSITKPLDDVERQLVEMDVILGDLLASARAGLADLRREPIDLVKWIEDRCAAETIGSVAVLKEKEKKDGEAAALLLDNRKISVDSALLGRALHNVLANAWAHGHPKDVPLEVTISSEQQQRPQTKTDDATTAAAAAAEQTMMIRIAVRDRGPGFAADILPRAFDPFVTGTGAARSPGSHGIGLGLSLVRRIVEAHGGSVSAENVGEGLGAIVSIALPFASDETRQAERQREEEEKKERDSLQEKPA